MTDLLARYWQGVADAVVAHPAYSDIGLPNQDLSNQRSCLLHLANITPTGAEDWRYFGKHALPLVLQSWVELANNSMRQFRAKPQEIQIFSIEVYIITLCESHCTCRETGLCVHACHTACSLLTYNVKVCQGTWHNSGLFLHLAHGCIDTATKSHAHAVDDVVAPDPAPAGSHQAFAALMRHTCRMLHRFQMLCTFLAMTEALGVVCSWL